MSGADSDYYVGRDGIDGRTPLANRIKTSRQKKMVYRTPVNIRQFVLLCEDAHNKAYKDGVQLIAQREDCRGLLHFIGYQLSRFAHNKRQGESVAPITTAVRICAKSIFIVHVL